LAKWACDVQRQWSCYAETGFKWIL
jgi:hypothetical protein